MSINTEFDFWPEERLAALVSCLHKSREGKPLPPNADERDHLPSEDDFIFWVDAVQQCDLLPESDMHPTEEREDLLDVLAQELASAVHTELRGRTYSKVREGLYLGDLSGPESRLTLLWLGVRGVVTVASHDIERLWMADGIAYHTAVVDTSADSIGPCLPASCSFLDRHNCAFVCCAAGQGLSLLVCAAHLATSERWASHGPGGPVSETPGELLRELAAQCDANTPFPPVERAALSAYCTWRFLQRTSPPREDSEAEDSHEEEEEEVAPCTPVNKPAPAPSGGPFSGISAIDLVKVACSTRKRARDEEDLATSSSEEAAESAATPQSKHAKKLSPCAGDGGYGFGQKEGGKPKHAAMVGGVASTMVGGTNDTWQRIA